MIIRAELQARVREWGLTEEVVEKDYVLGGPFVSQIRPYLAVGWGHALRLGTRPADVRRV